MPHPEYVTLLNYVAMFPYTLSLKMIRKLLAGKTTDNNMLNNKAFVTLAERVKKIANEDIAAKVISANTPLVRNENPINKATQRMFIQIFPSELLIRKEK